ncbi:hypothetical protein [Paenibacillus sp. FSL H7-0331]|uniref:hypothetical protein n=1 Tax=Paenibacillus sp. FSL H7-0331 TaxID=1920421 RepID=UPI00096E4862|nr:hypothetical protein [Paenibacillus sp. FSL H7-0331]OME97909.1 hypothetical protein BK127_40025 [Paenibacillus sp. FSL H7-0331]
MLNRKSIKAALAEYKEAKIQGKSILKDKEIQALFAKNENDKAVELMNIKFPEGSNKNVNKKGIALVVAMSKDIPDWKDVDPMDVYVDFHSLNRLLELAERV